MSVVSKLLRALRALPLALILVLEELFLWAMAEPLAALADLSIWIWNQLVKRKRKRKLYSYVTWRVPKDGFVGLLKRAFRQIHFPL